MSQALPMLQITKNKKVQQLLALVEKTGANSVKPIYRISMKAEQFELIKSAILDPTIKKSITNQIKFGKYIIYKI